MANKDGNEITAAVLLRDRELYRKVIRRITFEERLALLDFSGNYRIYQRTLHNLAKRHGVEIHPAK